MRGPSLVLLLVAFLVRAAGATTAADIPCLAASPVPGPCVVDGLVAVTPGSTLDFGARGLVLTSRGTLDAGGGTMSIFAGSLELQSGALLASANGSIDITTSGAIQIQGGSSRARINVSGSTPGSITLVAGGDLSIAGLLLAQSTTVQGGEGLIDVTGSSVTVSSTARLAATGGRAGYGGSVSVEATDTNVTVSGQLDASGGSDGGCIEIDANDDVVTTDSAFLDAKSGSGGSGDAIDISSTNGKVMLAGVIAANATPSDVDGGGGGADVSIDAAGTIVSTAIITTGATGTFGAGGYVDFTTDTGDIVLSGPIDASGPGTGGSGGFVDFEPTTGVLELQDDISVAGTGQAGEISVESWGDIHVASGRLTADGPGTVSNSGISFSGCGISVDAAARLSSVGAGNTSLLQASGPMTIAGPMLAGAGNRLEYLVSPPSVVYPTVPPAVVVRNPTLTPCGGPVSTTTTTLATTTTTITGPGGTTSTTTPLGTTTTSRPPTTTTTTSAPAITTTTVTTVPPITTTTTTTTTTRPTTTTARPTTTSAPSTSTTLPGTERAPTACVPSDCDDGDPCTDDGCDPVAGCVHDLRTGIDGVSCFLDAITSTLATSPVADVGGPALRRRLKARVGKIHHLMDTARRLAGARRKTKLHRADRVLASFIRVVHQGDQSGKVMHAVAERLLVLAADAQSSLAPLTQ